MSKLGRLQLAERLLMSQPWSRNATMSGYENGTPPSHANVPSLRRNIWLLFAQPAVMDMHRRRNVKDRA